MNYYTNKLLDKYKKDPVPVVYAYRDAEGKIIYIGSTKDLYARHKTHISRGKICFNESLFNDIDFYLYTHKNIDLFVIKEFVSRYDALKCEEELINSLLPIYNKLTYDGVFKNKDIYISRKQLDKKDKRKKKVDQYTLDGKFIKTFKSLTEAANLCDVSVSTISGSCKGIKTNKDYIWKYHE